MEQLVIPDFPAPAIKPANDIVPSVFNSQREMLSAIQSLYGPIQADVTYSSGEFWKGIPVQPEIKADLTPRSPDVIAADFTKLPFESRSIRSMIIDPPFLVDRGRGEYAKGSQHLTRRFTAYDDIADLMSSYSSALYEAYRVLKSGGYLAFKCQDTVNRQKQIVTHCHVWQMALAAGFYVEDLMILLTNNRMIGRWQKQLHTRKFHCYMWIFRKPKHGESK